MKTLYTILGCFWLAGCAFGPKSPPVLVYLPTFTPTATFTPTSTTTPSPTLTPTPAPTKTPTLTPEPWLQIELSVSDAETGEAVAGDVYVGLSVDSKTIGELIEEDVSHITFNLPRGVLRADAVYINVLAEGYLNRLIKLPPEAKTELALIFEAKLQKSKR
jgi:hypothetical protein